MTSSSLKQARQQNTPINQNVPTQVVQNTTPVVQTSIPVVSTSKIPSGWKQYADQNLGFSVAYPSKWTVKSDPLFGVTISAPRQNIDGQYGNMLVDSSWRLSLGKAEQAKIIDPLTKYVEQGSNTTVSGIKAIKSVKFDNANLYQTTINFVANSIYDLVTELWAASGNTDNVKTGMKSDATNILNQITSSLVIK